MNIFHIPSWYPNKKEFFAGNFIRDYIYAYAASYKEGNHIVSNQHEYSYALVLKKPLDSLKELLTFLESRK